MKYFQTLLKSAFCFFLILICQVAAGQEFDVRSFSIVPNDLSARKEVHRTVNDEPCALVKVITNIKGMQFQSNIGIVDVDVKTDGYWIYIAPKERRIKLMAEGYLSRDVPMPEPAEQLKVYELIVAKTGTGNLSKSKELISVTFRLNEENVFIRSGGNAPVAATGKSAVFYVTKGRHRFTFSKSGFEEQSLEMDVQETAVTDIEMKAGEEIMNMSLSGFLVITSEPQGAEVFLNDQRIGTTPYQGQHLPGDYDLALRSYLYYDHNESFTLNQGSTYQLPKVNLKPQFGYISVTTMPLDAEVIINDKPIGEAPIEQRQLSSGYHSITIRKGLYHDRNESFTLEDSEEKNIDITLKPAFGSLSITSEPSGAEVFIDEVRVGTTPYLNQLQPSGSYNVRVEKELHVPSRSAISVTDEEKSEKFYALTANFGTLIVESPEAEIYIDNELKGRDQIEVQLAPGNYRVEARREKHDADLEKVFIIIGEEETISLKPKPRLGALSIMTEPFDASGADVWVDGEKTEYKTPTIMQLLEGKHEIRLVKKPFNDEIFSVTIKEGEEVKKERTMKDKPIYPPNTVHCIMGGSEIVDVINPATGKTWMDRNLGGSRQATKYNDKRAYGDLYQWGRFSDGHQCRKSSSTNSLSSASDPGHDEFILIDAYPLTWLRLQNENLWHDVNGVNNPCPAGYRLPTEAELDAERLSWSNRWNLQEGAFNSPLRLTVAGYRNPTDGSLNQVGSNGYYWSGSTNGFQKPYSLVFGKSMRDSVMAGYLAYGFSVRCIKD